MLDCGHKVDADTKLAKRRASVRLAVKKNREREDAGLGLATLLYDAEMFNLLVCAGLVRDGTTDKKLINAGFSRLVWTLAHKK
jgi:hypothetical protein